MFQNKGRQEVSKMIDFLEEYVDIHFTSEEKLHVKIYILSTRDTNFCI